MIRSIILFIMIAFLSAGLFGCVNVKGQFSAVSEPNSEKQIQIQEDAKLAEVPQASQEGLNIAEESEEKIPFQLEEGDFVDDTVLIFIKTGYNKLNFTSEDFPEIEAESVQDSAASVLRAEGKEYVPGQKFPQMLSIKLKNPGREQVIAACEALDSREDIYLISPNYIIKTELCGMPAGE